MDINNWNSNEKLYTKLKDSLDELLKLKLAILDNDVHIFNNEDAKIVPTDLIPNIKVLEDQIKELLGCMKFN